MPLINKQIAKIVCDFPGCQETEIFYEGHIWTPLFEKPNYIQITVPDKWYACKKPGEPMKYYCPKHSIFFDVS
jgi:hypothetical protein